MSSTKEKYQNLIQLYNSGIEAKDPKLIRSFLDNNLVEDLKEEPAFYLEILQLRAASFSLFGELEAAGEEYRKGYASCSESGKWVYGLNWALQYMAEFSFKRGNDKIEEAMKRGSQLIDQALLDLNDSKYQKFYQLCLCNVKAFMHLAAGEKELALASFNQCEFIPVPIPEYNDKESLQMLFANYTKGLAVAIELKNLELLKNLLKVISIDDQLLYGESNLFKVFYETLISAFDMRAEFITEFNSLFKLKDTFTENMPEFSRFLGLIGEQNFDQLDGFFKDFE